MVADMLHANQSIITLRDSNDNQLTIAATYGINIPPFTLPMDSSLSQKVINEYITIYINDTIDCPELFTPKLLFSKIRSIIATPLIQSGNIIGTIEVYSQKVNAFDDNDAAFLTVIAHHAGAAITAAKLYEETKQKLLDEKHLSAIAYSTALTIDANAMMDECTHHVLSALHADIAIGCLSSDLEYNFSVVSNVNINNKLSCIDLNLFPPLNAFIDKLQPFNFVLYTLRFPAFSKASISAIQTFARSNISSSINCSPHLYFPSPTLGCIISGKRNSDNEEPRPRLALHQSRTKTLFG